MNWTEWLRIKFRGELLWSPQLNLRFYKRGNFLASSLFFIRETLYHEVSLLAVSASHTLVYIRFVSDLVNVVEFS